MEIPQPKTTIAPFVRNILLMENVEDRFHEIPIYADGFPGIMYSETDHPVHLLPRDKELSPFFLYGQTIEPIILTVQGPYKFVVLQLFPFAARLLLGVDPKVLNDDCYDLRQVEGVNTASTLADLEAVAETEVQTRLMTTYIEELIKHSSHNPDHRIKMAVNMILKANGQVSVKDLRRDLYITERTFERSFAREIGVTPKQFARIIQFKHSLNQLSERDYLSLSEVGHESGFADQSHFIRTFKRFAGKTPKEFLREIEG